MTRVLTAVGVVLILAGTGYIIGADIAGSSAGMPLALGLYCGGAFLAALGLGLQEWRAEFGHPKRH